MVETVFPSARPPAAAITCPITRPMSRGERRARLRHGGGHQRVEVRVGELGRQIRLDRLGLVGLARRQVLAARLAVGLLGLAPALALAPQHGLLVVRALLRVLLELGEDQAQRRDAIPVPRLHGGGHIGPDLLGDLHPHPVYAATAMFDDGMAATVPGMRAAILREYDATPELGEFDDPEPGEGQIVGEVLAAGLNPVDVRKASGTFWTGKPPLPSVAVARGRRAAAGRPPRLLRRPRAALRSARRAGPARRRERLRRPRRRRATASRSASASPAWRAGSRSSGARSCARARPCSCSAPAAPSG